MTKKQLEKLSKFDEKTSQLLRELYNVADNLDEKREFLEGLIRRIFKLNHLAIDMRNEYIPNDDTVSKDNMIKKHFTNRGFVIGEFEDLYGAKCSIQESSLADKSALWLGVHKPEVKVMSFDAKNLPPPKIVPDEDSGEDYGWHNYILPENVFVFSRMHLDIDMAKELVKLLNYFIENGTLPQDGISDEEDNKHENRD